MEANIEADIVHYHLNFIKELSSRSHSFVGECHSRVCDKSSLLHFLKDEIELFEQIQEQSKSTVWFGKPSKGYLHQFSLTFYIAVQTTEKDPYKFFQGFIEKFQRFGTSLMLHIQFPYIHQIRSSFESRKLKNFPTNFHLGTFGKAGQFFNCFSANENDSPSKAKIFMNIFYNTQICHIAITAVNRVDIFKISFNFDSIVEIRIEKTANNHRVYIDLATPFELGYYEDSQRNSVLTQLMNYKRVLNFLPLNSVDNCPALVEKQLAANRDECFMGLCRTICLEGFQREEDFYCSFIHLAKECSHERFRLYVANHQVTEFNLSFDDIKSMLDAEDLPYNIHYACLCLFSYSYSLFYSLYDKGQLEEFFQLIKSGGDNDSTNILIEQAIYLLKTRAISENYFDILKQLQIHMSDLERFQNILGLYDGLISTKLIREAKMNMSYIEFFPPSPLPISRFTSIYDSEYCIRITVIPGNIKRSGNEDWDFSIICQRLFSNLLKPLRIKDRCYTFLGSSSSNMRQGGILFYAKDKNGINAHSIRRSFQELSQYSNNVSKYIARFGMLFSQGISYIIVDPSNISIVDDIYGELKPKFNDSIEERYNFTDGIGMISPDLVTSITQNLEKRHYKDYRPSAFQIRLGGCKGMLVEYPNLDNQIIIRKSQCKFLTSMDKLFIVKASFARALSFNRPLVNILDQNGCNRRHLFETFYTFTEPYAMGLFSKNAMCKLFQFETQLRFNFLNYLRIKLNMIEEPFFKELFAFFIKSRLPEVRDRVRIRLPLDQGRSAFGIVDETGALEYGQVFFKYTVMNSNCQVTNETIVHTGPIMITKFPSLQPGDLRKFTAVDIPALYHIKDCIVFPRKGPRPHPDEMAGSDLDGDEYAVFLDERLYFPGDNHPPMLFPYGEKDELDRTLVPADIAKFYTNYLLKSSVGQIANCHLQVSDFRPNGLHERKSEELALKYSLALDFQKSGIAAPLDLKEQLFYRPDFLKSHFRTYLSSRILGQFSRHCDLVQIFSSEFYNAYNSHDFGNIKSCMMIPGWEKYENLAKDAYEDYSIEFTAASQCCEISCEGNFFLFPIDHKVGEAHILWYKTIMNNFGKKFRSQASTISEEDRHLLASAWYSISFKSPIFFNNKPLIGMIWLLADEVVNMLSMTNDEYCQTNTLIKKMDDDLNLCGWRYAQIFEGSAKQFDEPIRRLFLSNLHHYQIRASIFMVKRWINAIRSKLFGRLYTEPTFVKDNWKASESQITDDFIECVVPEIYTRFLEQTDELYAPTVGSIFRSMMILIYSFAFKLNETLQNACLEKICFVKYAPFVPQFLSSISVEFDTLYYEAFIDYSNKVFRKFEEENRNEMIREKLKNPKETEELYGYLFSEETEWMKRFDAALQTVAEHNKPTDNEYKRVNRFYLLKRAVPPLEQLKNSYFKKFFRAFVPRAHLVFEPIIRQPRGRRTRYESNVALNKIKPKLVFDEKEGIEAMNDETSGYKNIENGCKSNILFAKPDGDNGPGAESQNSDNRPKSGNESTQDKDSESFNYNVTIQSDDDFVSVLYSGKYSWEVLTKLFLGNEDFFKNFYHSYQIV